MIERRPDPDAILADIERQAAGARRGKLKIFFGASAGVGKTYAMLEAAQRLKAGGADVVVGYAEPHGRRETEALLQGLERLPFKRIEYRGTTLNEFDLDAGLARHPRVMVVDEMAHTNTPGARHAKRWQDIEELRDAGIDIFTTVNVQHLESLGDVVAQITGIRMQETVPDTVFESATEVELVDLPADELLERLRQGQVYVPESAQQAMGNFFRKGNLIALRELALRKTAERVDAAMEAYRNEQAIGHPWAAAERVLVAIGPGSNGELLIRAAKGLATSLHATWIAVYVETPDLLRLSDVLRNRRIRLLRLAESLGAETVTLGGRSAADELLAYAKTRNATRLLVGDPSRNRWLRWIWPTTVDVILTKATDLDITVVKARGSKGATTAESGLRQDFSLKDAPSGRRRLRRYLWSLGIVAAATLVGWAMVPHFEITNVVMVYLLGVTLVAFRHGRGPAILASVLSVAAFDFLFVPPRLTFAVSDAQYVLTFLIMLTVAMVISNLTASVRLQARVAGHRERRTALLYAMSRELAVTRGREAMAEVAVIHTSEVFDSKVVVLLPAADGKIAYPRGTALACSLRGADLGVAQWVSDHGKPAGLGTDTLPGNASIYLPLNGAVATLGVIAVLPPNPRRVLLPEQYHLLETFAGQIALAIERSDLAERAQQAQVQVQTEATRNALLAGISHDLRTPLAVIAGAASSLLEAGERLEPAQRQDLARNIYEESTDMADLISNVLEMTRLESGQVTLRREWLALEEVVGAALHGLRERLSQHHVVINIPRELPFVRLDGTLMERVFRNLLENAAKYTPAGTRVEITASAVGERLRIEVADNGPGLPPGDPERLFAKFQRGANEGTVGGVGLGLAICRAVVQAHQGTISAVRGAEGAAGGARFVIDLPLEADAPRLDPESARELAGTA